MKTRNMWLWLILLPLVALAQTNTNTSTVPLPPADLPKSVGLYWDLGIGIVTALLVTGLWKLAPKIPLWVLPSVTPFIGLGLGLIINSVTSADLGWVDMAEAGALAVFIREVVNKTKLSAIITKKSAAAPPVQ